jgi:uncharacterized cupin superfamily protein
MALASIARTALEPWPLAPESIRAGNPEAYGAVVSRSADGRKLRGIWYCTPGTFRWHCTYDETLVVLEGRATVRLDNGEEIAFGAGDMVFIPLGQWSTWTIHETFRKGFHADSPEPLAF